MPVWMKLVVASTLAMLLTGCQAAVFRFANRGLPPPAATVRFAEDLGLSMDVYQPHDAAGVRAPVVVFFYGGSWRNGTRSHYRFVGQRLAENGVIAVIADYRTYPQAVFPAFMDDAARAIRRVHDSAVEWGGDPDRLYVAGHSAGAQIAALMATDPRYLQAQGMQPTQLAGVIGLSGPYDFEVTGDLADVFDAPALWPRAQAVNFASGDEPPFLLLHGTGDRTVEYVDSIELGERLRAHGVPATVKLLPDAGHLTPLVGLYDPARAPDVLREMMDFIHGKSRPAVAAE